jgi:protein TonB
VNDAVRELLFWLTLLFSLLVHAVVLFVVTHLSFEPPEALAPQLGQASVQLVASPDAQREPAKKQEPTPEVPPEPVTEPPPPIETNAPAPPPPPRLPEPEPEPKPPPRPPTPPKKPTQEDKASLPPMAKTESAPSPASRASEGVVDQLPTATVNPAPPYPLEVRQRGLEGTVTLLLQIDATGKVAAARVVQSSGIEALDDSALRTIRRWVFSPARRNGQPVNYEVTKEFRFRLRDAL